MHTSLAPMRPDQVTVFVPVKHFHEPFLRQAIDSVFRQTRDDWRMLIVLDADRDEPFRALLRTTLDDSRVRLIHREGRLLAGSYNTAMRAAETDFVATLLGDDLWAPNAVEVLGDCIRRHSDVDFFHSGRYFIDGNNQRLSSDHLPSERPTLEDFWRWSPVKHLLCWRARRGLACGGVDETLNNFGSDDYDFPWTMMEHGAVFHSIPEALYVMRDHREAYRLTTHVPRSVQLRELRRILEKHGVPRPYIRKRLRRDKRHYLKQSLFRNRLDRWLRRLFGFDPQTAWREPYS